MIPNNICPEAMFTVVIAITSSSEKFQESIHSLDGQNVRIIAFHTKNSEKLNPEAVDLITQSGILMLENVYETIYTGYSASLSYVQTQYVQFWKAGDSIIADAYSTLSQWLSESELPIAPDVISLRRAFKTPKNISASAKYRLIDLQKDPQKAPISFNSMLFKSEPIINIQFNDSMPYDAEFVFLWEALLPDKQFYHFDNIAFIDSGEYIMDVASFSPAQDSAWYIDTLNGYYQFLCNTQQKCLEVPMFIQYGVFFALKKRYDHNINTRDKHVCTNQLDELWDVSRKILGFVDDTIILNAGKYKSFNSTNSLKIWLMDLKYDHKLELKHCLDIASGQVYLSYNGLLFEKFSSQKVVLDVINREKESFLLECSFMELSPRSEYRLMAEYAGNPIEITDTERFSHIRYFGFPIRKKRTFTIQIPFSGITESNNFLVFYAEIMGRTYMLKYNTSRFPARLNKLKYSYWYCKPYMITFAGGQTKLRFSKPTFGALAKQEFHYLKALFHKSKRMVLFRLIYWLTYPYFSKKHIWVTFDKLYKAGDNGEYFYRYALEQKDGITVKYLANKGYPDTERLKKEGLKPLYFGSTKQRLYFMHASVIAATHANIPVFSGIRPLGFSYVQDLFKGNVVCIQHGLAVQQLAHNLNSQYDNTKKFYCASPYEINNLSQKEYGYYDKKDIELVGVCRYDGLHNRDQKQILIIPTWRSYISMPASIGNTRPYSEDFKDTTYFKVFDSLIHNQKLASTAKACGYKLVYLLHPTISSQLEDFHPIEGFEVLSPVGVNYEKILTESSLMVTDYSGVQFDFAYMRKPIVYYHTPLLPPHYEEGGFFYDSMGFGEICESEDQLVSLLEEYLQSQCQMKPFYIQRADDFFAYSDHNNCERVYNAIKQFDEEQQE